MAAAVVAPDHITTTEEELQSAWRAMRSRHSLRHWPASFEEVIADPLRAKCIAIEATAARQRQRRQCTPVYIGYDLANTQSQTNWHWHPPKPTGTRSIDLKRAAAGDSDD